MAPIPDNISDDIAVILLVDLKMVNDNYWEEYIDILVKQELDEQSSLRVFPVAYDQRSFNVNRNLPQKNFLRAFEHESDPHYVFSTLTHEFCRLLYNINRSSEKSDDKPPLKLFISHAKEDGVKFAKQLRDYIHSETPVKTFFDANDIAVGYDFPQEIEKNIEESVLVVVHTDKYSSREWCRKEVMFSKEKNRPVVILNLFNNGEDRSFPYMSNVRTLRVKKRNCKPDIANYIILFILKETLRFKYQELFMEYAAKQFDIFNSNVDIMNSKKEIFSYPSELLTVSNLKSDKNQIIIYPDPPLGQEELKILSKVRKFKYITPTSFPLLIKNKMSKQFKISLSISEIEDSFENGFSKIHLQDALVEISRYLLVSGYNLAYGGSLSYKPQFNFAKILLDTAKTYNKEYNQVSERIDSYLAYPYYKKIPEKKKAEFKYITKLICVPNEFDFNDLNKNKKRNYKSNVADSLTLMRQQMAEDTDIKIAIGGKLKDFQVNIQAL